MAEIQWGPAIGFLAAGLGIGALILWRLVPKAARPAQQPQGAESLARRDLQARFDALIAQIRELEDTAGKRTAAQLERERGELELAAAEALVALDAIPAIETAGETPSVTPGAAAPPVGATTPVARAGGSSLTGFFWGIGSAAALGLLFYFVAQSARERDPSGSVTGNAPMADRAAPPGGAGLDPETAAAVDPFDTDLAALTEQVRRNPDDLAARLELARLHLMREDLMAVFNETQEILRRDADNPRALSYQALVRLAMGQADSAEQMLLRALQRDPDLFDAYVHLLIVYTTTGRTQEADAVFERTAQKFPDRAPSLRQLLAAMKAKSGPDTGMPASGEDPHAGVEMPGAVAVAESAPAGTAPIAGDRMGNSVSGVIELDPSVRAALSPGAALFVTLRLPGVTVGPPLAARRLAVASFPLPFEIGQADSMTGAEIPDTVLLEIRLDTDGDLSTRPRSDPYGSADEVKLGTRSLRVVLAARTE